MKFPPVWKKMVGAERFPQPLFSFITSFAEALY
jgi:hypothetical protein